jgi:hypothetical protein
MRKLMIVTCVLFAACGTDPVSFDGYPEAFRDAYCRYLVKCGEAESVDTCTKLNISLTLRLSASQLAAVDMSKVVFNGDKARSCLDAFASRSCDETSQSNRIPPDDCREILVGTQHDGDACARSDECISQVCTVPRCGMACCQGTCSGDEAPGHAKLGESCEHATCDPKATYCDPDLLQCVALKASGGNCLLSEECGYGLTCDLASGTCLPLPAPGAACTGACRDAGTTCSPTSRTCVKVALEGGACNTSADCSLLYRCDATKHCNAGIALGAACVANQHCADDQAFCDIPDGQVMGTCTLPKADGMPCQRDSNCENRTCDPLTSLCGPEPVCI